MTDIPAYLLAHWPLLAIVLAVVVFFLACLPLIVGWYLRRLFVEAFREPEADHEALVELMGDLPQVPEKAKRKVLNGLHPTKGYGWASRHGKRSNG